MMGFVTVMSALKTVCHRWDVTVGRYRRNMFPTDCGVDMAERKLLFSITRKDFTITYFSGTGAGGQHRNKHQNCVRMTHKESGASATAQNQRSRPQNEREAFLKIVHSPMFKIWHSKKVAELLGRAETAEARARKSMMPKTVRVEVKSDEGLWTPGDPATDLEIQEAWE